MTDQDHKEQEFYLRYYVGHSGKFGHEFLEFELKPDGLLRYANNSHYKHDVMIRKQVNVSKSVIQQLKLIVEQSEIMKQDDRHWPQPDEVGKQELEIVMNQQHISFVLAKIGSMAEIESGGLTEHIRDRDRDRERERADIEGLKIFYFLIQDLRALVFSLISLHFKIKPI